jgi:hypothetical protein
MPKQPTLEDLGGALGIGGARPIGSYDVDEYARGAHKMAEAGEHLGASISRFGEAVDQVDRQRTATEWTDRSAATYARLIDLRSRLHNDPNYATLEQRWQDGARAIIDDGAAGISHPGLRDRFQIAMSLHLAKEGAAVREQAFRGAASAHAASREGLVQNLERHSSLDPDDTLYAGGIDSYHAAVDDAVARGYLAPDAALAEKRNAALRLGTAHYQLMARVDPERAVRELEAENSPNPNVRFFPDDVKGELLARAHSNQQARQIDAERDSALSVQQRRRTEEQANREYVKAAFEGMPGIANSIANDDTLSTDTRNRLLATVTRTLRPDPPPAVSNANTLKLLARLRGDTADA